LGDYLGDSVWPPNTWGLSECSNYQFLSLSTMFGCSGTKYQFPNPDINHAPPNLPEFVPDGKKVYFNGSNYGVPHLARESYTHYLANEHGVYAEEIDSINTTDDINVFVDYANITVPRTINYATGLLNYFFRGKLSIEQNDCNNGKIQITITNKSGNSSVNQMLKGGTFTLYWDDSSGNRTPVSDFTVYRPGAEPQPGNEWNSTNTLLNYNESTKAILTPPESNDVNYILVYEGIISSDPNSPDTDDTRQIGTGVMTSCQGCCYTYQSKVYLLSSLSYTGRNISLSDSCRGNLCYSNDGWANVSDFQQVIDIAVNPKKEVLATYKTSQGISKWAKIDGCRVIETGNFPIEPTYYYSTAKWDMCTSDFIVPVSTNRFYKMSYNGNVVWDTGDIYPGQIYYPGYFSISPRYIKSSFLVNDNGIKVGLIIINQDGYYSYTIFDSFDREVYESVIDSQGNLWSCNLIDGHYYLRRNKVNMKELDGSCYILPSPSADTIYINGSVGSYQYYIGAIDSISGEYKWRRDFWQMRLVGDMHYIFGEDIILIKQLRQASDWGSLEAFSAVDGSIACYLGEILQDHYSIEGIYGGCGSLENMHTDDCQAQPQECLPGKKGQISFRVVDSLENPISGAIVDFSYDGIISGNSSAISNDDGYAIGYTDCTNLHGDIVFHLNNVTKYMYIYKPESNACNQASCPL
jgi:hypothetical protein